MVAANYLIKSALNKVAGRWDRKLADIIRTNPQGQAASVLGGYLRDFGDFKVPTRQSIRQVVGKKQLDDMDIRVGESIGRLRGNIGKVNPSTLRGQEASRLISTLIANKLRDFSSYDDQVYKYFQNPSAAKSLIAPRPTGPGFEWRTSAARKSVSDYLTKPVVG
jgi:hypothetical protein